YTFLSTPTLPSEIYTLSLHDALPIWNGTRRRGAAKSSVNTSNIFGILCVHVMTPSAAPKFAGTAALPSLLGRRLYTASTQLKIPDRKSTRLNSSHRTISYAVFCLKKK